MNDLLTAMAIITPIAIPLTEANKRAIPHDVDRWAPLISMACGVGAAFLFPPNMVPVNEVAAGLLSGLAASGLYSGTRATVMGK